MKFIITGGAGFIGSNIAHELLNLGHRVKIIDNFSTGDYKNIADVSGDIEVVEGDVRNKDFLKNAFKNSDIVLHQAAIASVQASIADPIETEENNVIGTINVLISAKECNIKRVVFASSAAVYGDSDILSKHENLVPTPLSPYAVHKLSGEYYMKIFNQLYGLETVCLRYFNVFGPKQNPSSEYSGVISKFVDCIYHDQIPTVFGDGQQTRDFVYIKNIVNANIAAALSEKVGQGDVINIASGQSTSLNMIISYISQILNKSVVPDYREPRKGDIKFSQADISKAKSLLDFQSEIDTNEGLIKYINWINQKR